MHVMREFSNKKHTWKGKSLPITKIAFCFQLFHKLQLMQTWANKERLSSIREASNISSQAMVVDQVNLIHEVCACAVHWDQTIVDRPDMVTFWTKYAKVRTVKTTACHWRRLGFPTRETAAIKSAVVSHSVSLTARILYVLLKTKI